MSNEAQYDPYALDDSVNVLGAGTVTIDSASFGYDAQYASGEQLCAIVEGKVVSDGETYDWRKLYSVGKGWEAVDQGQTAQREDGKVKNFRADSKYGLFVAGALAAGAGDVLRKRGTPQNANIWNGLVFEVEAIERDYGGEIGKKSTLVPVKFLGEVGKVPAASPTSSAPAPAAAAQNGAVSGALKAKLKKLAKECDTHEAFIDRAFVEISDVDGNKAAETLVADDPSFYEEARA